MQPRLLFLGGNGHCSARLEPARWTLARLSAEGELAPFDIYDDVYAGFEDRPRAPDFETFLNLLSDGLAARAAPAGTTIIYGTGIGGLLALCLRARGEHLGLPLLLQAPVLWGLERRWMPRLLRRFGLAKLLLRRLFALTWFQQRFLRKQFERPVPAPMADAFFAGYARCSAAPDLFAWLTPALLRQLERQLALRPEALQNIGVWWGERDRVVNLQELACTEQALGIRWPVRVFPHWGHYPMIDEPESWVRAISDVLATPEILSRSNGPEAR